MAPRISRICLLLYGTSDLCYPPGLHPWPPVVLCIHVATGTYHTWTQFWALLLCRWPTNLCHSKNQWRRHHSSAIEIILFGPPMSPNFTKPFGLPSFILYMCQTYRQRPGCNIWQWPFIWKTSYQSCLIMFLSVEKDLRSVLSRPDLKKVTYFHIILVH